VKRTFITFQPMKSLAEMDGFRAMRGTAYREAMGEDGRARMRDLYREAVWSTTNQAFSFNPKMSAPSKQLMAGDPAFWTPKPDETKKKE
jgi:hypothetical protein